MSRTRLDEILARRKLKQPQTAVASSNNTKKAVVPSSTPQTTARPKSAAVKRTNDMMNDMNDDDTASVTSTVSHTSLASVSAAQLNSHFPSTIEDASESQMTPPEDVGMNEDDETFSLPPPVVAPSTATQKPRKSTNNTNTTRQSHQQQAQEVLETPMNELISRQALIRLARSSEIAGGLTNDFIDACQEVLQMLIEDLIQGVDIIRADRVNDFINKNFHNGEQDLPMNTVISPASFDRFLRSICQKASVGFKRDASYLLQLYCEGMIMKLTKAADLVATSGKRSRIQGSDLTVAYHIYNM